MTKTELKKYLESRGIAVVGDEVIYKEMDDGQGGTVKISASLERLYEDIKDMDEDIDVIAEKLGMSQYFKE